MSSERIATRPFTVRPTGKPGAAAILVERPGDLARCVAALNPGAGRPVLVLVGGADGLDPAVRARFSDLFRRHLLPLLTEIDAVVVDGGTDAGVMACAGRANIDRTLTLVGVAAIGTVAIPGRDDVATGDTALEPNHSHFLLVPGDRWGDESPWLSLAADAIAAPCPSLTLVVGGGSITRLDVRHSLAAQRPVILLKGSGGVADELAAGPPSTAFDDAATGATGTAAAIMSVDLDAAAEQLPRLIRSRLTCPAAADAPSRGGKHPVRAMAESHGQVSPLGAPSGRDPASTGLQATGRLHRDRRPLPQTS